MLTLLTMLLNIIAFGVESISSVYDTLTYGVGYIYDAVQDYVTPQFIKDWWYNNAQDYVPFTQEMLEDAYGSPTPSSESSDSDDDSSSQEIVAYIDHNTGQIYAYETDFENIIPDFTRADILRDLKHLGYKEEVITEEQIDTLFSLRRAMGEENYRSIMLMRYHQIHGKIH